jgi:NADH:ubiquinone oxidoreductase subunit E
MNRGKGGTEVEKFYDTVLMLNPRLKKEPRINPVVVEQLLATFNKNVKRKKTIDYDELLAAIAKQLNLPAELVEPFVEVYVTAFIAMSDRKFTRLCGNCHQTHAMTSTDCMGKKDLIVKTKAGFVVVDGEDRPGRFKN